MSRLDDAAALAGADPGGMLQQVAGLPDQLARAAEVRAAIEPSASSLRARDSREVVVCGMGGSAIGAEYASVWAGQHALRVSVSRDYALPTWVGPQHLLLFSSYSGNTEETLSAFAASMSHAGARACITTGGRLEQLAAEHEVPVVKLPPGLQPRAALGHSLVALLSVLHAAGVVQADPIPEVEAAARLLRKQGRDLAPQVPESRNRAKQLARMWHEHWPCFYTGSGALEPVGRRWKAQVHENAKAQASAAALPEMNHNEIMAWQSPPEVRRRARLFFLRDASDPEPTQRRMTWTAKILRDQVAGVEFVDAVGGSVLERALSATSLGDYASVYLAFLYDVDPTPVEVIETLKRALARSD
ncbi:MAG: bifunctional phosphoglucose/phosphomannose isomerase [Candidatus Latescibacterota bacterium]|nr:MAG: bifunctional phosphoglucose/phosphomannose isomerase [Candidatus Latescibacterota bacterium]